MCVTSETSHSDELGVHFLPRCAAARWRRCTASMCLGGMPVQRPTAPNCCFVGPCFRWPDRIAPPCARCSCHCPPLTSSNTKTPHKSHLPRYISPRRPFCSLFGRRRRLGTLPPRNNFPVVRCNCQHWRNTIEIQSKHNRNAMSIDRCVRDEKVKHQIYTTQHACNNDNAQTIPNLS